MGMFGYLTAFQEMIDQLKLQAFSALCAHFVHIWSRVTSQLADGQIFKENLAF